MRYSHEVKFIDYKIHSFYQMGCCVENAWMRPPRLPVTGSETRKSFITLGPQCPLLEKGHLIYLLELNETNGRGFLHRAICWINFDFTIF